MENNKNLLIGYDQSASGTSLIEFKNVYKSYGSNK